MFTEEIIKVKVMLSITAVSLALALAPGAASAQGPSTSSGQAWPSKPVRLIVPFTAGAASDVLGRIVGQRFSEIWGQQIVIDNRPGAGGLIGSDLTRQAAPDGYTLAMVGQPHLSNVLLREDKPYDPLKDFTAISLVGSTHNVIVLGKGIEAKTIPDLIAIARAKPGALNYGSAGVGSSSHLAGALFASKAKIDVVHVPFRIGADSRSALIAGTIHYYVYPLPAIVGMIKAGTLRALAVASPKRVLASTARNRGSASSRRAGCRGSSSCGSMPTRRRCCRSRRRARRSCSRARPPASARPSISTRCSATNTPNWRR